MDISVVLCTYNRASLLNRALESLGRLDLPEDLQCEFVIVDNNSTDATKSVVEQFSHTTDIPVVYSFEKKQGLSHARQNGIDKASGQIIAFTDDDVLVDRAWVNALWGAFQRTDAACVGGVVLPIWEVDIPAWLTPDLYGELALLDMGEHEHTLDRPRIWGANMAFRASVLKKHGGFDTRLGRTAGKLYAGEETDLMQRILDAGEKLLYCPSARVSHFIPRDRLRKSYFRKWRYDQGELKARGARVSGQKYFGRVPHYMWRYAIRSGWSWFVKTITFNKEAFTDELDIMEFFGYLVERWR